MSSSEPKAEGRGRTAVDWLRKLAAIVLVLSSVTIGIVGLMFATEGRPWGIDPWPERPCIATTFPKESAKVSSVMQARGGRRGARDSANAFRLMS